MLYQLLTGFVCQAISASNRQENYNLRSDISCSQTLAYACSLHDLQECLLQQHFRGRASSFYVLANTAERRNQLLARISRNTVLSHTASLLSDAVVHSNLQASLV